MKEYSKYLPQRNMESTAGQDYNWDSLGSQDGL